MTDRDVVERVAALLQRALVPLRRRRPNHKQQYATVMKGSPAVKLMKAVRPFLGSSRQSEIDRAIGSWHGRPARWRRPAKLCLVQGCARSGAVRGLCRRHYDRWWKASRKGRVLTIFPAETPGVGTPFITGVCSSSCSVVWLAGLLEGEGTFSVNATPPHAYPLISVQMCDEDVVTRAARILGAVGIQRREPENINWSVTYVAKISGYSAANWMRRLRPYMGLRRIVAIDRALAAYHPIRLTHAPSTCVVPGCDRPHRARGLCNTHYMSWSRDRAKGRAPRVTPLR